MPTYSYRCEDGHEFVEWASIKVDSMLTVCECGVGAVKVMVPPRLSQSVTPNRTPSAAPSVHQNRNSWEKGIVKNDKGVPLLDENYDPIPVKKYAENRHKYEARRHELASSATPFADANKG